MTFNELPLATQASIIKSCVRGGIYNLDDIRTAYSNFVEGRNIYDGLNKTSESAEKFGKFLTGGGNLYDGESSTTQQMRVHKPYYDSDGALHFNITMPEIEVWGRNRSSNYIQKAKQERQRQKEIAKSHFTSTPSIENFYKGLVALVESSPFVTTSATVNPYMITGEAPNATPVRTPVNNTTKNFLKWLGKSPNNTPRKVLPEAYVNRIKNLTAEQRGELLAQEQMLRDAGVDMSRIDAGDIIDAYDKRALLLAQNTPERYTIARPAGSNGFNLYDTIVQDGNPRTVGKAQIYGDSDGRMHMGFIENLTRFDANKVGGIQENGLNAAINAAKSRGMEGVISGEQYQNAPLQLHVIEKFTDRIPLPGRGNYSNYRAVQDYRKANNITPSLFDEERYVNTVEDMKQATPDKITYLLDPETPAFFLQNVSRPVPTKSTIFDPRRITETGEMPFNWDDPYIFKNGGLLDSKDLKL